jgi:hypothetical protein
VKKSTFVSPVALEKDWRMERRVASDLPFELLETEYLRRATKLQVYPSKVVLD